MKSKRSWQSKMDNPKLPQVTAIPPRMQKTCGTGMMVIPSPREVEAVVRSTPKGRVTTYNRIRKTLAGQHMVETACPLCTGLFVRIAAEAAEEAAREGKRRITPYWRVVRDNGALNPKFPGGVERQAERLREEGHRIVNGGREERPPSRAAAGPRRVSGLGSPEAVRGCRRTPAYHWA